MRKVWPLVLFASLLLFPSVATAQERGKAGVVMAFPASIGATFDVSPRVALRPDVSFSSSWSDSSSPSSSATASSNGYGVAVNIAALLYLRKRESLNLYFVPRFGYGHSHSTSSSSSSSSTGGGVTQDAAANVYSISASFGAEHPISRRFGVFGELGFGYSKSLASSAVSMAMNPVTNSTSRGVGTRASVGTILYF